MDFQLAVGVSLLIGAAAALVYMAKTAIKNTRSR